MKQQLTQPTAASKPSKDDNTLDEWDTIRTLLEKFDDRIQDLRKLGFTFITALLTAQSLLLPDSSKFSSSSTTPLPTPIKLMVIMVTLCLIVALRLIERNYDLFERAAVTRGLVIERRLNLELTEIISDRARSDHFSWYVTAAYAFFAITAGTVGYFVVIPTFQISILVPSLAMLRTRVLFLSVAITIAILYLIGKIRLTFSHSIIHGQKSVPVDWTIYPLECKEDEWVTITVTNLDDKECITFVPGEFLWKIRCQDPKREDLNKSTPDLKEAIVVKPENSHTWLWKAEGLPTLPGVYELLIPGKLPGESNAVPLKRKVIITR